MADYRAWEIVAWDGFIDWTKEDWESFDVSYNSDDLRKVVDDIISDWTDDYSNEACFDIIQDEWGCDWSNSETYKITGATNIRQLAYCAMWDSCINNWDNLIETVKQVRAKIMG